MKRLILFGYVVMAWALGLYLVVYALANPSLTQTQLLIAQWPVMLLVCLLGVGAVWTKARMG